MAIKANWVVESVERYPKTTLTDHIEIDFFVKGRGMSKRQFRRKQLMAAKRQGGE